MKDERGKRCGGKEKKKGEEQWGDGAKLQEEGEEELTVMEKLSDALADNCLQRVEDGTSAFSVCSCDAILRCCHQ